MSPMLHETEASRHKTTPSCTSTRGGVIPPVHVAFFIIGRAAQLLRAGVRTRTHGRCVVA